MRVEVVKRIRAPIGAVFAWCTDYRDDDPGISGVRLRRRRVVRRNPTEVELEESATLGVRYTGRVLVRLHPPDWWEADLRGTAGESHTVYRLRPDGAGTRLTISVEARLALRYRWLAPLAARIVRRQLSAEWDDYVRAMEAGAARR